MTINTGEMQQIVHQLIGSAAQTHFKGYDPYDFAETTSGMPHALLSKLSFLNKVSPVNFRPLLGIRPTNNAKANGLWLLAMVKTDMVQYATEIQYLLQWIEKNTATEFEEFSMGFSFKMALARYASGPGKTSLIISLFTIYPLIEMYARTKDQQALNKILSFESLLDNKWMKFESEQELWYSYLPAQKDEMHNATAKVGRFYASLYAVHQQPRYLQIIEKIQHYLLRVQQPDGHWGYSVTSPYADSFHTAFVLESIHDMVQVVDKIEFRHMFVRGMAYYRKYCFTRELVPLHFSSLHKPKDIRGTILGTEIRDCANAIILFSKTGRMVEAAAILEWTKHNFYSAKQNYFSFYRNRMFTNNINFIRWQSWMALAICEYLHAGK